MEVYLNRQNRQDYFKTQIEASRRKFNYCKVSVACVERFREVISRSSQGGIKGPILCLGTRNGREVDIFRKIFFANRWNRWMARLLEKHEYCSSSRLPLIESLGRSRLVEIDEKSVVGVEINTDGKRRDVLICSFDELPQEWEKKFKIIYSNTLDHAYDPYLAAKEWYRVLSPGGYIILGYAEEEREASLLDPVGNVTLEDLRSLFPGELIYFNRFGNALGDVIIKKKA